MAMQLAAIPSGLSTQDRRFPILDRKMLGCIAWEELDDHPIIAPLRQDAMQSQDDLPLTRRDRSRQITWRCILYAHIKLPNG